MRESSEPPNVIADEASRASTDDAAPQPWRPGDDVVARVDLTAQVASSGRVVYLARLGPSHGSGAVTAFGPTAALALQHLRAALDPPRRPALPTAAVERLAATARSVAQELESAPARARRHPAYGFLRLLHGAPRR